MRSPFEYDDIYDFDDIVADVDGTLSKKGKPSLTQHKKPESSHPNLPKLPPALVGRNIAAMAVRPPAGFISHNNNSVSVDVSDIDWHKERLKLKAPKQPQKLVPLKEMLSPSCDRAVLQRDPVTKMHLEREREKMLRSQRCKVSGPVPTPHYSASSQSSHSLPRITARPTNVASYDSRIIGRPKNVSNYASDRPAARRLDASPTIMVSEQRTHNKPESSLAKIENKQEAREKLTPVSVRAVTPYAAGSCTSIKHTSPTRPWNKGGEVERYSKKRACTPSPPAARSDGVEIQSYSRTRRKLRYQTSEADQAVSVHKPSPGYHRASSPLAEPPPVDYEAEIQEHLRLEREMERLHDDLSTREPGTRRDGVFARKNKEVFNDSCLFSTFQHGLHDVFQPCYDKGDSMLAGSHDSSVDESSRAPDSVLSTSVLPGPQERQQTHDAPTDDIHVDGEDSLDDDIAYILDSH